LTRARAGRSLSRGWIVGLAVGGLTGLVFSRSVGYGFVAWDDEVLARASLSDGPGAGVPLRP
jgi:hypothetical protein